MPGTAEHFNWSEDILRFNIPLHPILEKLVQVPDFLIMSITVAFLHLGTGFLIGVLQHGMELRKALETYTVLTIGDGLVTVIPAEKRSHAIGMFTAAQAIGISAGPGVGGILLDLLSWRWVFWVVVPFSVGAKIGRAHV